MTLHISVISIQGDARQALGEHFIDRGYRIIPQLEYVSTLDELTNYLLYDEDKAITYTNGRTNIIDHEMVLLVKEEMWKLFSIQFGSVITMICEGVSGSYGYWIYRNGERVRNVLVVDTKIVEQFGESLPEESGIDFTSLYEVNMFQILTKLGFNFYDLDKANSYRTLEYLEIQPCSKSRSVPVRNPYLELLRSGKNPSRAIVPERKKPWWKFW
jgi:hypothetical protein